MDQINTSTALQRIMNLSLASNGVLSGAIAGLFTGSPTLGRLTTVADLGEATFGGYARSSALSWGTPLRLPGTGWAVQADRVQFVANTSIGNGTVITGGFLVAGTGNNTLLGAVYFDDPIPLTTAGDAVQWAPAYTFDFNTNYNGLPGPL